MFNVQCFPICKLDGNHKNTWMQLLYMRLIEKIFPE